MAASTSSAMVLDLSDPTKVVNSPLNVLIAPTNATAQQLGAATVTPSGLPSYEKLFTLLCNYLSLSQYEIARPIITELFFECPERITHLLRSIVARRIPDQWLLSNTMPSIGHLQWLALIEYGQLYCNTFDRTASLTPGVPLVVSSKDQRFTELAQSEAAKRCVVNPFGFITHDQLIIQVLEVNLRGAVGSGCYVRIHQEGDETGVYDTPVQPVSTSGCCEYSPPAKVKLNVNVADAHVVFTVVTTTSRATGTPSTSGAPNPVGSSGAVVMGKAVIGLHQLRNKEKYHIWVPIIPLHAADATQSDQLGQRIRIRIRWKQVNLAPRADGSARLFDDRTMSLLETDILLAHAAVATAARKEGNPANPAILQPGHIEEIRSYCLAALGLKERAQVVTKFAENALIIAGGGTLNQNAKAKEEELRSKYVPTYRIQHSLGPLRKLVREYPTLGHSLCSHLAHLRPQDPTWIYLYAELIFEMLLRQEYAQALHALHVLAQEIYPGEEYLIALQQAQRKGDEDGADNPEGADQEDESADSSNPGAAVTMLSGPRAMMREVYRAMVHYIYDDKGAKNHLFRLLSHRRTLRGDTVGGYAATAAELAELTPEEVAVHQKKVLARKCRVYGSLIGNEQVLRQFCALEDYYLHGTPGSVANATIATAGALAAKVKGMPKKLEHDLPFFFQALYSAMQAAQELQIAAVREYNVAVHKLPLHVREPIHKAREDALSAFWMDYYGYCRVHRQHIFEFPIKVALECIEHLTRIATAPAWHNGGYACSETSSGRLTDAEKAQLMEVFWKTIEVVMVPFNLLRPLLVLLAWDRVNEDFTLRRELIQRVWRPYHRNLSNAAAFQEFAVASAQQVGFSGMDSDEHAKAAEAVRGANTTEIAAMNPFRARQECSEPKLVVYCNRLDFYLSLIDLVLDRAPSAKGLKAADRVATTKWLLDMMNKDSCIKAIHPYLVELQPLYLVDALSQQIELEMEIPVSTMTEDDEFKGLEPDAVSRLRNYDAIAESMRSAWTEQQYQLYLATGLGPDGSVLNPERFMKKSTQPTTAPASVDAKERRQYPSATTAVRQANCTELLHDLHVLCTYYAIRSVLWLLQEYASDRPLDIAARTEALKTCRSYLLAMRFPTYQVAALEKIYCLFFATKADIAQTPAAADANAAAANLETINPAYAEERRRALELQQEEIKKYVGDASDPLMDEAAFGHGRDEFVLKGELLLEMLKFMHNTIHELRHSENQPMAILETQLAAQASQATQSKVIVDTSKPLEPTAGKVDDVLLLDRLQMLETQIQEGLWRAETYNALLKSSVVDAEVSARGKRLGYAFNMAHIVAPLHYMAAFLLQRRSRGASKESNLESTFARFPIPALPSSLVEKSVEAKNAMQIGVDAASAIVAQQSAMQSVIDGESATEGAAERTRTITMNRSLQSLVGIHNDLVSQREHATRLLHNSKVWDDLQRYVEDCLCDAERLAKQAEQSSQPKGILKTSNTVEINPPAGMISRGMADPKRLAPAVSRFIERHCRSRVPGQPPEEDEILEMRYLFTMDIAIAFADRLQPDQYYALIDSAIEAAERLKVYYQTILFSRFAEPAYASADALLSQAAALRKDAALAQTGQQMLKDDLQARIEICELYLYYAKRRREIRESVAQMLLPPVLFPLDGVDDDEAFVAEEEDPLNLRGSRIASHVYEIGGEHRQLIVVRNTSFFAAWRKYVVALVPSADRGFGVGDAEDPDEGSSDVALRQPLPFAPWTYDTSIQVVRYLAQAAARDAFLAHQKRFQAAPDFIEAMGMMQVNSLLQGLTALDPAVTATVSDGSIDTCVVAADGRTQAVVARTMLPALAALRFGAPAAIDAILGGASLRVLDEVLAVAVENSRFLPSFARWVDWRAEAYRRFALWIDLLIRAETLVSKEPKPVLIDRLRGLIARESPYKDAEAYLDMFLTYIHSSQALSVHANNAGKLIPMRLAALKLADEVLDDPVGRDNMVQQLLGAPIENPHPLSGQLHKHVNDLIESLVLTLTEPSQQPLRAQLIMRLRDPFKAAQLAVQYISLWTDTEMASAVALRCYSNISASLPGLAAHIEALQAKIAQGASTRLQTLNDLKERYGQAVRLRDELAISYQYIILHQSIRDTIERAVASKFDVHLAERFAKEFQNEHPARTYPVLALQPEMITTWSQLREAAETNLEDLNSMLMTNGLMAAAIKVFVMRLAPVIDPESLSNIERLSAGLSIFSSASAQAKAPGLPRNTNIPAYQYGRWWYGQSLAHNAGPGAVPGLDKANTSPSMLDKHESVLKPSQVRTSINSNPSLLLLLSQPAASTIPQGAPVEEGSMPSNLAVPPPGSNRGPLASQVGSRYESQIRFPREMFNRWCELAPKPLNEALRNQLSFVATRLEPPCLVMLLSATSPARDRMIAIRRIQELCSSYDILNIQLLRYTVSILDYPPSRLLVMDIVHKAYANPHANPYLDYNEDTVQELYPNVPPAEALIMHNNYVCAKMIGSLPHNIQLDLAVLLQAGVPDGLSSPADIIEGLLRLDHPSFVAALFPKFKNVINSARLLQLALDFCRAMGPQSVRQEIGLYFFELVFQYPDRVEDAAHAILKLVRTFAQAFDTTSMLLVRKLLHYCYVHCYHKYPRVQAEYDFVWRSLMPSSEADQVGGDSLGMLADESVNVAPPVAQVTSPRGRHTRSGSTAGLSSRGGAAIPQSGPTTPGSTPRMQRSGSTAGLGGAQRPAPLTRTGSSSNLSATSAATRTQSPGAGRNQSPAPGRTHSPGSPRSPASPRPSESQPRDRRASLGGAAIPEGRRGSLRG